jgi:hypothetical protein
MSVRTMLVTVAGPRGRRDLSLPADTPVAELLPVLVRLVGDGLPGGDRWTLAPANHHPSPARRHQRPRRRTAVRRSSGPPPPCRSTTRCRSGPR